MNDLNLLGIDFGLKKVGLSLAVSQLADPLKVIRYLDLNNLINQIVAVIESNGIKKVIIGISEGKMAHETKLFAERLKGSTNVPIELFDETLSTQEAQRLAIESGIKQTKRKEMEDAMAASVMLQNYIDSLQ